MIFLTSASKRLNMTWKFSGSINVLPWSANHAAIFQRHRLLFRRGLRHVRGKRNVADRQFWTRLAVASAFSLAGAFALSICRQLFGQLNGHIMRAFDAFPSLLAGWIEAFCRRSSTRN